ncbi:hypothetical protein ACYPKM_03760 [Pseudomonas aeruginosa]
MKLHLVNPLAETLALAVANEEEAEAAFHQATADGWISGTLRDKDGCYIESFTRQIIPTESHPLITPEMIQAAVLYRRAEREGDEPSFAAEHSWLYGGMCHLVTEALLAQYGLARVSGTVMARDLETPICVHYWNFLPDLTIVDFTFDQLREGASYRIIRRGEPDWYRYQPEYEDPEDYESLRGAGVFSDTYIDLVLARAAGKSTMGKSIIDLSYLQAPAAEYAARAMLEPMLVEFYQVAASHSFRNQRRKKSFDYSGLYSNASKHTATTTPSL